VVVFSMKLDRFFARCIYVLLYGSRWIANRLLSSVFKRLMKSCGHNVKFSPIGSVMWYENMSVGDDVYVGPRATFLASESEIIIGSKVMFGPNVTIVAGDHNTALNGRYMFDVHDKRDGDDRNVVIGNDVWIGANVTILKGVVVGSGAVVAAGALVNKNVPSHSIAAGVPAKVVRMRGSDADICRHLKSLGEYGRI